MTQSRIHTNTERTWTANAQKKGSRGPGSLLLSENLPDYISIGGVGVGVGLGVVSVAGAVSIAGVGSGVGVGVAAGGFTGDEGCELGGGV